jgi:hypothetical protein
MAVDLRCPHCQDNLGKDVENPIVAYCSTCGGQTFYNERGYSNGTEEEKEFIRKHKARQKNFGIRTGRIITRY